MFKTREYGYNHFSLQQFKFSDSKLAALCFAGSTPPWTCIVQVSKRSKEVTRKKKLGCFPERSKGWHSRCHASWVRIPQQPHIKRILTATVYNSRAVKGGRILLMKPYVLCNTILGQSVASALSEPGSSPGRISNFLTAILAIYEGSSGIDQ